MLATPPFHNTKSQAKVMPIESEGNLWKGIFYATLISVPFYAFVIHCVSLLLHR